MLLWYPSSKCHLARFPRLIWRFALYLWAIDRLRGVHDFFGGGRTLENWGLEMKEIGAGLRVASGKQAVLGMKVWFCMGIREIPLVCALMLAVTIFRLEKWLRSHLEIAISRLFQGYFHFHSFLKAFLHHLRGNGWKINNFNSQHGYGNCNSALSELKKQRFRTNYVNLSQIPWKLITFH